MAFKLQSAKQIGALVNTAISYTQKGDGIIHEAAVQALGHAARLGSDGVQIGDITLFERLLSGLGKTVRVEGLRVWAQMYSPVTWNGDGKIGLLKSTDKRYKPFDTEAALANPFWTLKEADEMTRKPLDTTALLKIIHGLKGKVEKAAADGRFEGDSAQALVLVESIGAYADGLVAKNPSLVRDGAFDPNDPENAKVPAPKVPKAKAAPKVPDAVPAPAATPRRARKAA